MMPNEHFAINIKKLASAIFPFLTLCFLTSKLSKLIHIVFPHLKPLKISLFLFASSLGVLYWGSWGFFWVPSTMQVFFPSFLLVCVPTSLAYLTCLFCLLTSLTSFPCFACLVCLVVYLHCLFVIWFHCMFVILFTSCAYLVCLLLPALPTLCACFTCPLYPLIRVLLCHLLPPTSLLSPIFAYSCLFRHLLLLASLVLFVSWPIHVFLCLLCCLLHYMFCHLFPPWSFLQVFRLLLLVSPPTCLPCYFLV